LQDFFRQLPYAQLSERLDAADLAFAPLNRVRDLQDHPDFRTEPSWVGDTEIDLPVVPGRSKTNGHRVPALGQHTAEVKRWLESADE
jgi:crotonobetainyl-CoA:carnitine CoA-transferase CaiB-like acyl-CoA transferase